MTTTTQNQKSTKFEASLDRLEPYLDLFDRLCPILEKADEVEREAWTESWCRDILCELKHEFAREKLPKRETLWQMMLVEQCLQPLWDRITVDDLTTIEHELSRPVAFSKRVVHIGYVIKYWQHLLQCEFDVLERSR